MSDELSYIITEAEERYLPIKNKSLGAKVQMLVDLGYLKTDLTTESSIEQKTNEAFQFFYKDLVHSDLISQKEINGIKTIYQDQFEIKLLEAITDIDEGITIKNLPSFGDVGLAVRMIHYRLSLIGLYSGPPDLNFNSFSYTALENAAAYIGKPKLVAVNLLANLQGYTKLFINQNGYQNSLLVFKCNIKDNVLDIPEYKSRFKRQLKEDLKDHENEFEVLDEKLFHKKDDQVDLKFANEKANNDINRFILRLIQVHQWMAGFYDGAVDSEYSDYTIKSLLDVIDDYNEGSKVKIRAENVLARVRDNIYIFNCLHFLRLYSEENAKGDKTVQTLEILSDSYRNANPEDQLVFEENFQFEINKVINGQNKVSAKKNGILRRIFFGIKTFFKKAFRFARKMFRWIVNQVKRAATFIKNTIRMIYSYLKEAIRHFIDGVRFLLGRFPIISQKPDGHLLYSNLDFDKDGINVLKTASRNELVYHLDKVRLTTHSMKFSLAVIGFLYQILKTSINSAIIIGWPLFIMKLVISFKNVIESYKKVLTI